MVLLVLVILEMLWHPGDQQVSAIVAHTFFHCGGMDVAASFFVWWSVNEQRKDVVFVLLIRFFSLV